MSLFSRRHREEPAVEAPETTPEVAENTQGAGVAPPWDPTRIYLPPQQAMEELALATPPPPARFEDLRRRVEEATEQARVQQEAEEGRLPPPGPGFAGFHTVPPDGWIPHPPPGYVRPPIRGGRVIRGERVVGQSPSITPEEKRRQQERARAREEYLRRARIRSMILLQSCLTEDQKLTLNKWGWFYAIGGVTQRHYRIHSAGQVDNYCVNIRPGPIRPQRIPEADRALTMKLMIEGNENHFVNTAVWTGPTR